MDKCVTTTFDTTTRTMSKEVLLAWPNFKDCRRLHRRQQITAWLSDFARRATQCLLLAQTEHCSDTYTTTERELLVIWHVISPHNKNTRYMRDFKRIQKCPTGYELESLQTTQSLTHKHLDTKRVMHWRLLLEQYDVGFHCIKRENNIVADTLSRLELIPENNQESFQHGTSLQLFTTDTINDIKENVNPV